MLCWERWAIFRVNVCLLPRHQPLLRWVLFDRRGLLVPVVFSKSVENLCCEILWFLTCWKMEGWIQHNQARLENGHFADLVWVFHQGECGCHDFSGFLVLSIYFWFHLWMNADPCQFDPDVLELQFDICLSLGKVCLGLVFAGSFFSNNPWCCGGSNNKW